jgi:Protein of unknown function (DUF2569)
MSTATVTPEAPAPLTGVRGWLLFFVIVIFFNSLICLAATADTSVAGAFFTLGLFGVSLAAGIQLCRRQKSGVLLAKIFLIGNWATAVLAVIGAVAGAGNDPTGVILLQMFVYLAKATLFGGIWLAYLYRSVRVKNTYGL